MLEMKPSLMETNYTLIPQYELIVLLNSFVKQKAVPYLVLYIFYKMARCEFRSTFKRTEISQVTKYARADGRACSPRPKSE